MFAGDFIRQKRTALGMSLMTFSGDRPGHHDHPPM